MRRPGPGGGGEVPGAVEVRDEPVEMVMEIGKRELACVRSMTDPETGQ